MQTVKTDSENVSLALGEHLCATCLPQKQMEHVVFIPIEQASTAVVDVSARRVVWLSAANQLSIDPHCSGGKVKYAIKAYEKCYGAGKYIVLIVNKGTITSLKHMSQKHGYYWNWDKNEQVRTNSGWKY